MIVLKKVWPYMTIPIIVIEFSVMAYIGLLVIDEQTIPRALFVGFIVFFVALFFDVMNNDPHESLMADNMWPSSDEVGREIAMFAPIFMLLYLAGVALAGACILGVAVGVYLIGTHFF